jgi:hypothetical protein
MASAGGRPAVSVEGGAQLRRAFKAFDGRLDDLTALHKDIAETVADRAHTLVPRLTGFLADTISPRGAKTRASVIAGGRRAVYGPPIHFGWRARNIAPQPFLYDALDDRRDEVFARYDSGVGELVRRFDAEAPD